MAEPFDFDAAIRGFSGGAEAPAAAASVASPASASTPFYNRPIAVPPWLKSAGRFIGKAGALGAVAEAGYTGGTALKNFFEPPANPAAPNPNLAPEFRNVVASAGGTNKYVAGLGAKPENANGMTAPVAGRFPSTFENGPLGAAVTAPVASGGFGAVPAPSWQPATLPRDNTYRETPGNDFGNVKRGIGGVRGVGNTEVVGTPDVNNVGNTAGNFFGAMIGLKQIAGDNATKIATSKANTAAVTARANAYKDTAAGNLSSASLELAQRVMNGDPTAAQAAAALHGRISGGQFTVPMNAMPDPKTGAMPVLNRGSGAITQVTPSIKATDQHVKDTLAAHPELKTRAAAIKALKATGRYSTDGLE